MGLRKSVFYCPFKKKENLTKKPENPGAKLFSAIATYGVRP